MKQLVELNPEQHANLRVNRDMVMQVAKGQHLVGLKITEVAQAITCFPVFFSRNSIVSDWNITAITGIELNKNLFVVDDQWDAIYQPSGMKTYPFYLMASPRDDKGYTIGVDEANAAFVDDGEPVFDEKGKASLMLSSITAQLDEDVKIEIITHKFCLHMDQLGLLKAVDVLVHNVDESINTLTGLHTIDEEKLQELSAEQFEELRKLGYLAPMYGLLMSLYQLNSLIRRHNSVDGAKLVKQVTMEVTKEPNS